MSRRAALRLATARLRTRGRLRAGTGVRLGRGVRIRVDPGGSLVLGEGVVIGDHVRIEVLGGRLQVGPRTEVADACVLRARTSVTIGQACRLGPRAAVFDEPPVYDDAERLLGRPTPAARAVHVGDGVVIGPNAVIGPGARLPDGASVSAGSVVERETAVRV